MEALTSVSVAALTVVDMVKAVDKLARITDIEVVAKSGGKSGDWTRPLKAVVVVASNRASTGVYEDTTGPLIVEALTAWGFDVGDPVVVGDGAPVGEAIGAAIADVRQSCSAPEAPASTRPIAPPRSLDPCSSVSCPAWPRQ